MFAYFDVELEPNVNVDEEVLEDQTRTVSSQLTVNS